jgi:hypothetical protein
MFDSLNERIEALPQSLRSVLLLSIVSSISATVVLLFALVFGP